MAYDVIHCIKNLGGLCKCAAYDVSLSNTFWQHKLILEFEITKCDNLYHCGIGSRKVVTFSYVVSTISFMLPKCVTETIIIIIMPHHVNPSYGHTPILVATLKAFATA